MNRHPGMSRKGFENLYGAKAPWDIGRPQQAFVDLFNATLPKSPVIDIGCGSGELSLFAASKGCSVLGVDFSQTAIEQAKRRALDEGSPASFEVRDTFSLPQLKRKFSTVLDCCFFHVLDDPSRMRYEHVMREIIEPEGMIYMLCFSRQFPHPSAPRDVNRPDIEKTFGLGWTIVSVEPTVVEVTLTPQGLPGTFVRLRRNPQ